MKLVKEKLPDDINNIIERFATIWRLSYADTITMLISRGEWVAEHELIASKIISFNEYGEEVSVTFQKP